MNSRATRSTQARLRGLPNTAPELGGDMGGSRWLRWVGLALALGALGYYLAALRAQAPALEEIRWGPSAVAWFLLCVAIYPVTYAIGAAIWCVILKSMGQAMRFPTALAICAVSQFGKYLPGNLAHHVGRIALARREGLGIDEVLISMLLETANLLLAGTLIAGLLLLPGSEVTTSLPSGADWGAGIAVVGVVVVVAILALLWRGYRQQRAVRSVDLRGLPLCFGMQCGAFLIHGVIAVFLVTRVLGLPQDPVAALTGMFALAWVAGFVTPGAPAGIGVREAIISFGLAPLLGAGGAVALAGLLRVVSVVGDLLTFVVGLALSRRSA